MHLPKNLHHEKMSSSYTSGTADDYYSGDKADMWCEYKFLPKTPLRAIVWLANPADKKPGLSRLQQEWLNGRHAEGRTVAVVVGCPDGGIILRDQEWMREISPQMFRDRLVPRKAIAQWIARTTMR